jgi:hypothetical protein
MNNIVAESLTRGSIVQNYHLGIVRQSKFALSSTVMFPDDNDSVDYTYQYVHLHWETLMVAILGNDPELLDLK